MDDPFAVRHVDGAGQRLDERGRLARGPGLAVQPVRQAAALDPLQGQERPAFVAADLVDLHDVGVLHPRRQLRLQPETQLLGGRRELARQHHLQGRQPVEAPVPRLVHHPHAPAPDLGQDVVVPDLPGGGENHRRGFRVSFSRGRPGLLRLAQGANRRAALGRADQHFVPAGGALLEPRQQTDRRWPVDRCGGNTPGQSPRWAETRASSASASWPRDSARSSSSLGWFNGASVMARLSGFVGRPNDNAVLDLVFDLALEAGVQLLPFGGHRLHPVSRFQHGSCRARLALRRDGQHDPAEAVDSRGACSDREDHGRPN